MRMSVFSPKLFLQECKPFVQLQEGQIFLYIKYVEVPQSNNCYYSEDGQNCVGAPKTSVVRYVAVLCASSLAPSYDPADNGNDVKQATEEIAPAGNRSVSLRQMLFDFFQLLSLGDLLNLRLFHNFFTLSSDYVRIITLIDYHFFYRLSRGILLFLEKYFIFSNSVQLLFTKNSN